MKLKDLPQKLQDFAILRMVEEKNDINIHEEIKVEGMFRFIKTTECNEWREIFYNNNLEPMYLKYPELRP